MVKSLTEWQGGGIMEVDSLVPRHDWWGGREKAWYIHCMRMRRYFSDLNNLITYGYCLVYLPFNLNSSHSMYLDIDNSHFERDFKIVRVTSIDWRRSPNCVGMHLAWSLTQRSGYHPIFFRLVAWSCIASKVPLHVCQYNMRYWHRSQFTQSVVQVKVHEAHSWQN